MPRSPTTSPAMPRPRRRGPARATALAPALSASLLAPARAGWAAADQVTVCEVPRHAPKRERTGRVPYDPPTAGLWCYDRDGNGTTDPHTDCARAA